MKYVARSLFSLDPPALDLNDLVSSAAILFSLAVTLLLSTLGIGRSGNSVTAGPVFNPFDLFESASSDTLNFLLRGRFSWVDRGVLDGKTSLAGGATLPMEAFWTWRRSEGYFWAPKSALLTRVEVRRAVMVGNAWLAKLVA